MTSLGNPAARPGDNFRGDSEPAALSRDSDLFQYGVAKNVGAQAISRGRIQKMVLACRDPTWPRALLFDAPDFSDNLMGVLAAPLHEFDMLGAHKNRQRAIATPLVVVEARCKKSLVRVLLPVSRFELN